MTDRTPICWKAISGFYNRKLIQATLADGSEDTGWVYIMNKLPAVILSGDLKKQM